MAWDIWEIFVANYETFCNNLFVELEGYKEGISLREFYRGAVSKDSVLEIKMGLETLDLVCTPDSLNFVAGSCLNFSEKLVLKEHRAPWILWLEISEKCREEFTEKGMLKAFINTIEDFLKVCCGRLAVPSEEEPRELNQRRNKVDNGRSIVTFEITMHIY
ncbi:hypothetical protein RhiirA4_418597 [Rhizophagus irregularis]|uniref:Uncharacterized protein n=1 Tax=Rhizophagus irregularis TaxID=588596 RepID=A0A2I1GB39_9GLOM|nr:hypothetical protein RhiirA4_418597 [Rhizophagus irregularis]